MLKILLVHQLNTLKLSKKHTQICTKDIQIFGLFFVHICLIIVRAYLHMPFAYSPVIRAYLPIVCAYLHVFRAYLHTCICLLNICIFSRFSCIFVHISRAYFHMTFPYFSCILKYANTREKCALINIKFRAVYCLLQYMYSEQLQSRYYHLRLLFDINAGRKYRWKIEIVYIL